MIPNRVYVLVTSIARVIAIQELLRWIQPLEGFIAPDEYRLVNETLEVWRGRLYAEIDKDDTGQ
jgi:hypothetical protein